MAFQGYQDDYCEEDYEFVDDDELSQESNKVIHRFYFVKFNRNFPDAALEAKIEQLNLLIERTDQEKKSILDRIETLEKKIANLEKVNGNYLKDWSHLTDWLRQSLAKNYPESVDEDPKEAIDPEIEGPNIKERIDELVYELNHGNHKLVEEKRILKELRILQEQKEELEHHVKEVEARIPPRSRYGWRDCNKFEIQRPMRDRLNELRKFEERQERKRAARKEEIRKAEEKLCFINQKQVKIHNRIMRAQNKVDEQAGCYNAYVTLMDKVKELAAKKDLVALEQLSGTQVEGFVQRWQRDKDFRANYNRSVRSSTHQAQLKSEDDLPSGHGRVHPQYSSYVVL